MLIRLRRNLYLSSQKDLYMFSQITLLGRLALIDTGERRSSNGGPVLWLCTAVLSTTPSVACLGNAWS